jgi:hypothetical protein
LKGAGKTPLAWTNNASHADGKQSIREAIYSFVVGKANSMNGLDSTRDLAVFVMKDAEGKPTRSLTVRVGKQTRISHYRYHSDNPENFKKLADYIVRRDLGLPRDAPVTKSVAYQYIQKFSKNLGEEVGRYMDLDLLHGSPTNGNRTTSGATIDLAEFWYFDANHGGFSYLFDQMKMKDQTETMRDYINSIRYYMQQGQYDSIPAESRWSAATNSFNLALEESFLNGRLMRVGLTRAQIDSLPKDMKARALNVMLKMFKAQSAKPVNVAWEPIIGAAFDTRSVLSRTLRVMTEYPDLKSRVNALFTNDRSWSSAPTPSASKIQKSYLRTVSEIFAYLKVSDFSPSIARAEQISGKPRLELGEDFIANSNNYQKYIKPIVDNIVAGTSTRIQYANGKTGKRGTCRSDDDSSKNDQCVSTTPTADSPFSATGRVQLHRYVYSVSRRFGGDRSG